MAIDRGCPPILFAHNDVPWPLILPNNSDFMTAPDETGSPNHSPVEICRFPHKLHPDLAAVWLAMSNFCALINAAAETGGVKLTEEAFLHSMGSIMYSLLHQRFEIGSLDEAFRLGLLAFSAPIFLNWNRLEVLDRRFTLTYRETLAELDRKAAADTDIVSPRERLWLLMVAAVAMSHEADSVAWLKPRIRLNMELCHLATWDAMREFLHSFMWIGLTYGATGESVFGQMMLSQ